jgi:predicted PurR-regulated permease PerM
MLSYAQTAGSYLGAAVLMMFLIYFLLASGEMFKIKLVKLSGERLSQKKVTVQMIDEIGTQIGRFVFYQFWSGLLVGVLTWLAFMWMGVRYAGIVGRGGRHSELHPLFRSDHHHGDVRRSPQPCSSDRSR